MNKIAHAVIVPPILLTTLTLSICSSEGANPKVKYF